MKTETKPHPRADYPVPPVRRFERGQSVRLLLSMNRCCEKAVPLGKATCPDCEEASAGYQAAVTSREATPREWRNKPQQEPEMKPINYGEIIEKAEARRAALEAIIPKLQAVYGQWGALYAAAHRISSVNADYKRLDSEAAALLARSVGVSVSTLGNGLYHLANVVRALDHQSRDFLAALEPNEEARRLTPLQAMVATHYQGGELDHIETQDDAQNVGDGLFTFCINEAGDAGDKVEFINMLNRAIEQLRSLVGKLRDTVEVPEELP